MFVRMWWDKIQSLLLAMHLYIAALDCLSASWRVTIKDSDPLHPLRAVIVGLDKESDEVNRRASIADSYYLRQRQPNASSLDLILSAHARCCSKQIQGIIHRAALSSCPSLPSLPVSTSIYVARD